MELFVNGLLNAGFCIILMTLLVVIGILQAFFEVQILPKRIGQTRWKIVKRGIRFGLWIGTACTLFVATGVIEPEFPEPKHYAPDTVEIARILGGVIGISVVWTLRLLARKE